eukprot:snap_masked-scaffold_23-processed-gene-0.34-mRNA-1 protein AED:1.00 eAED:1.00 QI:0/-1/0/0/-1/1/1/0/122
MEACEGSFYDELERESKIVVRTSQILERKEEDYQFKETFEHSIPQNHEKLRNNLFTEHISYLSPFYSDEQFHELDLKALVNIQKQVDEEFRSKCAVKDKMVIPKKFFVCFLVIKPCFDGTPE